MQTTTARKQTVTVTAIQAMIDAEITKGTISSIWDTAAVDAFASKFNIVESTSEAAARKATERKAAAGKAAWRKHKREMAKFERELAAIEGPVWA